MAECVFSGDNENLAESANWTISLSEIQLCLRHQDNRAEASQASID